MASLEAELKCVGSPEERNVSEATCRVRGGGGEASGDENQPVGLKLGG